MTKCVTLIESVPCDTVFARTVETGVLATRGLPTAVSSWSRLVSSYGNSKQLGLFFSCLFKHLIEPSIEDCRSVDLVL